VEQAFVLVVDGVACHRHHLQFGLGSDAHDDRARHLVVLCPEQLQALHRVHNALTAAVSRPRLRNQQTLQPGQSFGHHLDAAVSNAVSSDVQRSDEVEVVRDDFAGEGSQEVIPGFELLQISETADSGDLAYEVLILQIFVVELCRSAVPVYLDVLPLVGAWCHGGLLRIDQLRK
jgi:hypothetical protein